MMRMTQDNANSARATSQGVDLSGKGYEGTDDKEAGDPANRNRRKGGYDMQKAIWLVLVLAISGCVPVAIGATAAVVADQEIEKDKGGDGLF